MINLGFTNEYIIQRLRCTNEVIDTLYEYHYDSASGAYEYWTEVKEELEKL